MHALLSLSLSPSITNRTRPIIATPTRALSCMGLDHDRELDRELAWASWGSAAACNCSLRSTMSACSDRLPISMRSAPELELKRALCAHAPLAIAERAIACACVRSALAVRASTSRGIKKAIASFSPGMISITFARDDFCKQMAICKN